MSSANALRLVFKEVAGRDLCDDELFEALLVSVEKLQSENSTLREKLQRALSVVATADDYRCLLTSPDDLMPGTREHVLASTIDDFRKADDDDQQ